MTGFKDIIGQEHIKDHLQNAIKLDKISHAYIIEGERYSGKEFIAKVFAAAVQCEKGMGDSCMECHSCKQAVNMSHPDIIKVMHEKPNSIGVDDIRIQVANDVMIKPYSGPKKIYIINEGEKMTAAAQNALLKTLEEPPSYTVIFILTTNLEALLPTILSRCVVLSMKPVEDEKIKEYLMDSVKLPDYKAEVCAAFSRGNVGKARMLAMSEDFDNIKAEAISLMKNIKDMEINEIVTAIKKIGEYSMDISDYLDMLAVWYRDVLLYKATNDLNHLIFKEEVQYIRKAAKLSTYEGIENIVVMLDKTKQRLGANVNFDLAMELLLLAMKEN